MSSRTLLISLFRYKAWADELLLEGLGALEASGHAELRTALRVLAHAQIVDRIFVANLQRLEHGLARTGTDEAPPLAALREDFRATDRWYLDYVEHLDPGALPEVIAFDFTDGTPGRMSREEMLAHVVTHAGYHRGEAGRILTQLTGSSPRDTFTGYLHEAEPARRA